MGDVKLIETREVDISAIVVKDRLRPVSDAGVEAVRASIRETGRILSPVWLRAVKDRLVLLDGGHRLTAAGAEGMATVPANIFQCTDRQARLLEIDGNLAGADLNALDTAVFLAARKRVYEEMHPEAKAKTGAELVARRWGDTSDIVSFVSATAEKLGKSKRQIERMVGAGTALCPDEVSRLRQAPRPVTLADLQAIAKIPSAPERYHVVAALAEGRARNAAAARADWKALETGVQRPVKSPVDEAHRKLLEAFDRAPMAAKRRFARDRLNELADLLQTGGEDNA